METLKDKEKIIRKIKDFVARTFNASPKDLMETNTTYRSLDAFPFRLHEGWIEFRFTKKKSRLCYVMRLDEKCITLSYTDEEGVNYLCYSIEYGINGNYRKCDWKDWVFKSESGMRSGQLEFGVKGDIKKIEDRTGYECLVENYIEEGYEERDYDPSYYDEYTDTGGNYHFLIFKEGETYSIKNRKNEVFVSGLHSKPKLWGSWIEEYVHNWPEPSSESQRISLYVNNRYHAAIYFENTGIVVYPKKIIGDYLDDFIIYQNDAGYYGIADTENEPVLPFEYSKLNIYGDKLNSLLFENENETILITGLGNINKPLKLAQICS